MEWLRAAMLPPQGSAFAGETKRTGDLQPLCASRVLSRDSNGAANNTGSPNGPVNPNYREGIV